MRPTRSDLQDIAFLADASSASKERILRNSLLQSLPAQVTLLEQGGEAHFLYVVRSGRVAATSRSGERSSIVLMAGPGTVFPASAVVAEAPMLTSAHTIQDSRLLMIPASLMRELIEDDAKLAKGLLVVLAGAARRMVRMLHQHKTATTAERLAAWILEQIESNEDQAALQLPFPKQYLASYLGTSPENMSRAIANLRYVGTTISGRKVVVSDVHALASLASGCDVLLN
ncbi:cyclic nucleotide-binding domain-containing protein [Nostoc sp. NIES-2111]